MADRQGGRQTLPPALMNTLLYRLRSQVSEQVHKVRHNAGFFTPNPSSQAEARSSCVSHNSVGVPFTRGGGDLTSSVRKGMMEELKSCS